MKKRTKRNLQSKDIECQACFQIIPLPKNKQSKTKQLKSKDFKQEDYCNYFTCLVCKVNVHQYCYSPSDKKKQFKCDVCKAKKTGLRQKCFICGLEIGALKYIHPSEPAAIQDKKQTQKFAHVLCALTSPKIVVQNYRNLKFKLCKKIPAQSSKKPKCQHCKKQGGTFKCFQTNCKLNYHLPCVPCNSDTQDIPYLIMHLLDRNSFNFFAINSTFIEEHKSIKFKGLTLIKQLKKTVSYICCPSHNDAPALNWCHCGKSFKQQNQNQQIQCSRCCRWVHKNCSDMKTQGYFQCNGCLDGNIFQRRAFLPQLVCKMITIEKNRQILKDDWPIIDALPYKVSDEIKDLIINQFSHKFEEYELKKWLEKEVNTIKTEDSQKALKDIKDKRIIQMIHYIKFKDMKRAGEISHQEFLQLQKQYISKKEDKNLKQTQKISVLLELYLSSTKKQETKDIKARITQFINVNKEYVASFVSIPNKQEGKTKKLKKKKRDLYDVGLDIRQILTLIQQNDKFKLESQGKYTFLELLLNSKIHGQDIRDLLVMHKKILYCKKKPGCALKQSEYYRIINNPLKKGNGISVQSKIKITRYFRELMEKYGTLPPFEVKQQITAQCDKLIQQNNYTYKKIESIRTSLARQGVFIEKNFRLINIQKKRLSCQILKRKLLKIIDLPIFDNKIVLQKINELISSNGKDIQLTPQEKFKLTNFKNKHEFYANVLRFQHAIGQSLYQMEYQQPEEEQYQENQQQSNQRKKIQRGTNPEMFKRVSRILKYWTQNYIDNLAFIDLMYPIALNKIKFEQKQWVTICQFAEAIIQTYNNDFDGEKYTKRPAELQKMQLIIKYVGIDGICSSVINTYDSYKEWKEQLESRCGNVSKALQDSYLVNDVLEMIQRKIIEARGISINLKVQINKLNFFRYWALLSQKYFQNVKKKATINAIQQLRLLMEKACYPKNQIMQKVYQLDEQGKNLNKRIAKFLQKPKILQLQLYEQLKILSSKMTIAQGQDLRRTLNDCGLDVGVELQQLEQELHQYQKIPKNISQVIKSQNLEEMIRVRKLIIQSPFQYIDMDAYCLLSHRISLLKCRTIQSPLNRKQFMKLLNTGDMGSVELIDRYPTLLKAYKEIQKAQKQVLNPRPKFQNLLPLDSKKLKLDLKDDPTQRINIQKVYMNVQKLREKFKHYKNMRVQYEKYLVLQNQLSHYPVNWKDIQAQIIKMKKQCDDLVQKVSRCKIAKNFSMVRPQEIYQRIRNNGIKHQQLEKFEFNYRNFKIVLDSAKSVNLKNYADFSNKCKNIQTYEENQDIMKVRQDAFFKVNTELEKVEEPGIQTWNALLYQASRLYQYIMPQRREQLLTLMMTISKNVNKIISQSEGDSSSEDEDEQQMDYDEMQEGEYDQQQQIDPSEYISSSSSKFKRKRDNNIVLDEQQQQEQQKSQSKLPPQQKMSDQ